MLVEDANLSPQLDIDEKQHDNDMALDDMGPAKTATVSYLMFNEKGVTCEMIDDKMEHIHRSSNPTSDDTPGEVGENDTVPTEAKTPSSLFDVESEIDDDEARVNEMDNLTEKLGTPTRRGKVVIRTPPKPFILATDNRSESQEDGTSTLQQVHDDDKASAFSLTDYGGDESELEQAQVTPKPKPKRRASLAYPTRRMPHFVEMHSLSDQRRSRANSCPAPVDRRKAQLRDARGRFTRKGSTTNFVPVTSKKSRKQIASSSSETELLQKQDANGHFTKTLSKPVALSIPVVETNKPPSCSSRASAKKAKSRFAPAKSPYFAPLISPPKTPQSISRNGSPTKVILKSCIPFPPLTSQFFGLIQEKLAHAPFRLLIAVTFLIRTHGKHAIPVFYSLMSTYPTPELLVEAQTEDIVDIIRHLGLQNSRACTYQTYAKIWLDNPPVKGKRYAVKDYPERGDGRDIPSNEVVGENDQRVAWEIGHMTSGPYALDSWRIFCRDILRGVATDWNGENAEEGFQPEWMRVLPEDKELRAYLRWMWLKEGFEWDPFTGEKEVASPELTRAAMEGRVAWDDEGGMRIIDQALEDRAEKVQGGLGMQDVKNMADLEGKIPDSEDKR